MEISSFEPLWGYLVHPVGADTPTSNFFDISHRDIYLERPQNGKIGIIEKIDI
jgi:hypothetical protein